MDGWEGPHSLLFLSVSTIYPGDGGSQARGQTGSPAGLHGPKAGRSRQHVFYPPTLAAFCSPPPPPADRANDSSRMLTAGLRAVPTRSPQGWWAVSECDRPATNAHRAPRPDVTDPATPRRVSPDQVRAVRYGYVSRWEELGAVTEAGLKNPQTSLSSFLPFLFQISPKLPIDYFSFQTIAQQFRVPNSVPKNPSSKLRSKLEQFFSNRTCSYFFNTFSRF